jgi:hypothetical protein
MRQMLEARAIGWPRRNPQAGAAAVQAALSFVLGRENGNACHGFLQKSSFENQNMRSNMIKTFYPSWAVKAFGESTKGSGWGAK